MRSRWSPRNQSSDVTQMDSAVALQAPVPPPEVAPVGEIDGQTFTVGEITRELMTAYSELVRNPAEASASAA